MVQMLHHRGPDEEGSITLPGVGLGMRRLAIVDLAGGQQPIVNETGDIKIVANGEIYNFRELQQELEGHGHRFHSRNSDIEVLVHAYEQWGEDFLVAAARYVRAGDLGRPDADLDRRPRPRRREAALLDRDRARPVARIGSQSVAGSSGSVARARSDRARPVPDLRIRHRAAHDPQGRSQGAARAFPQVSRRAGHGASLLGCCRCGAPGLDAMPVPPRRCGRRSRQRSSGN